jgi:ribokinase
MCPRDVVVVGSANADLVLCIDRRPAAGETILASDIVTTPGGKGANQAVAAGRIGGHVAFIGCVGDDGSGRLLRDSLAGAGVNVAGLRTVAAPTGTAIIMLTPDGENSIVVSPGANTHVSAQMLDELEGLWAEARVLVVQLEIPLDTVAHVVSRARAHGSRVVVNAAPAVALPLEVLAASDPLVVNESEAALLLGGADADGDGVGAADALARGLLGLGPRSVVVTLGPAGSVLLERGADGLPLDVVTVPARRVEVVDTTGAGDAFVGALAVELAAGADLEAAVRRATDVAAYAVGHRGAQTSYPSLSELDTVR